MTAMMFFPPRRYKLDGEWWVNETQALSWFLLFHPLLHSLLFFHLFVRSIVRLFVCLFFFRGLTYRCSCLLFVVVVAGKASLGAAVAAPRRGCRDGGGTHRLASTPTACSVLYSLSFCFHLYATMMDHFPFFHLPTSHTLVLSSRLCSQASDPTRRWWRR